MSQASEAVRRLIEYTWTDWTVSMDEERAALGVLRTDPDLAGTIRDLKAAGTLKKLVARVKTGDHPRVLVELLGGGVDASAAAEVRACVSAYRPELVWEYEVSAELQGHLRTRGAAFTATPFNSSGSFAALIPANPAAPFTGVGATGKNAGSLSIPLTDQAMLAAGHTATRARYSNPISGSLPEYLATLTADQRKQQAAVLLQHQVSSVVPHSYAGKLPTRADMIRLAADAHALHPPLLAAFILAEQRDQSKNEDAAELAAAKSVVMRKNTSIGLGQVVITTARNEKLFADLVSNAFHEALSPPRIATLLSSDEFNIFAVARYIRLVANRASGKPADSLPKTKAAFPKLNLTLFAKHSTAWPDDNIRALGSEYTSRPWDDKVTVGWADFVLEAYRDVKASGVL